jgi:KUP system potassium uptake protein
MKIKLLVNLLILLMLGKLTIVWELPATYANDKPQTWSTAKMTDNTALIKKVTLIAREQNLPPLGVPVNPQRNIGFDSEFVRLENYIPKIQELSNDRTVPKYATHLVYMTSANNPKEIEHKVIYSILNKKPKRADIYWLVHIDTVDNPYTCEYKVDHIIPNDIIRIDFRLGFRMQPRINLMFRKVVEDLVANKEVNIFSRYESLPSNQTVGDFQFIVLEKYLSQDNDLPFLERVVMKFHFWLKEHSLSEEKGFGLDLANVTVEKFPLVVAPVTTLKLKRVDN